MKKLIIDTKTGKQEYLEMTSEEEAERLAEIAKALVDEAKEQAKEQEKRDLIEGLKLSTNAETLDLLKVLNLG